MRRIRGVLWACSLAAALSIATTNAMSITPNPIFEKADTCGGGNLAKWVFVYTVGRTNHGIMLPNGPDGCTVIAPIVCDLKLQDPASNPNAQVKTTVLNGKLPSCGSNCCPFGYSCGGDGNCVMDQDQSKKPQGAKPAPTSTGAAPKSPVPSPTSKPLASGTSGATPSTIATAAPASETAKTAPSTFPTGAVVGGAIGGVLGFSAIVFGFLMYRRRQQRKEGDDSGSLGGRSTSSSKFRESEFHCRGQPPQTLGPRGVQISKPLGTTVQSHQWYDESIAQNTLSNHSTPMSQSHGTFQPLHHRPVPPRPSENPFASRGSTASWESDARNAMLDPLRGTINVGLDLHNGNAKRLSGNASLQNHVIEEGVLEYLQHGHSYDRSSNSPADRDMGRESHYPDEYDGQEEQRPPMPPMPPVASLRPPQQGVASNYSAGRNLTAPESKEGKRPETTWEIIQRQAGGD
ncbi:hypothetical protein PG994_011499 [Apiospora phragmitis]|uniref:Uncharacterized protein n=1 Tax=Apiospora phragmitis TaxID=2905665 RepID=A0ABR1TSZ1_9PEZI